MDPILQFDGISKSYGKKSVLDNLSFTVPKGQCFCLLGPNGAGKTTTINLILGLIQPDHGQIKVLSGKPGDALVKSKLSCTPQETQYIENIKVGEILNFVASHYKKSSVNEVINNFSLENFLSQAAQKLSGGQKRLLALACCFVSNPELVILDEPTVGLDIEMRQNFWSALKQYKKKGLTILLTTHYLTEAEVLSDRIIVIDKGQILIDGTPERIISDVGVSKVTFSSVNESLQFPNPYEVESLKNQYTLFTKNSDHFVKTVLHKLDFSDLKITKASLEEAVLRVMKK